MSNNAEHSRTLKVQAMVCHAAGEPLVLETLDLAAPVDDEILVEIMASGLCHTDASQISGASAPFPFPVVAGHEGAGIVREVGPAVTDIKVGDHVVPLSIGECGECENCLSGKTNLCMAFLAELGSSQHRFSLNGVPVSAYGGVGSFAQFIVIKQHNAAVIRKDVPFDLACLVGCAVATGVGAATKTAQVAKGDSVAVFGLGGIGLNVLQGAQLAGASRIIGIDLNPARAEEGKIFGMTDFINPADGDAVDAVRSLTAGGVDHSFECVGHPALMKQALDATRIGWGCCTVLGVPADGQQIQITPFDLQLGRTVKGSFMGNMRGRSDLPMLLDHYVDGRLKLDELVSHHLPIEQVNTGFQIMEEGAAKRVVVSFTGA
ncbi:zinc-binding dehydrogenase [Sphingopyxis yananensis]|uniref:zinc-binding dehydrogenase n=1 Tax=Sphingopyxis yananensis TaxID=2886687 RepID=UPI001D1166CA|nr:zinc-binding dehydrogenase [Sphingopyxis yananensis]MCC2603655.1 alcohol dehydrogenase catalytic domain-containing protein [Sphingopyxis yananensis]